MFTANPTLVETIEAAIRLALKQWLDENRQEVLSAIKTGVAETDALAAHDGILIKVNAIC